MRALSSGDVEDQFVVLRAVAKSSGVVDYVVGAIVEQDPSWRCSDAGDFAERLAICTGRCLRRPTRVIRTLSAFKCPTRGPSQAVCPETDMAAACSNVASTVCAPVVFARRRYSANEPCRYRTVVTV